MGYFYSCNSFKRGKQLGQGAQADLYETTFAGNKYALRHEKVNPKKMKSLIDEMKVHDIIMADINKMELVNDTPDFSMFGLFMQADIVVKSVIVILIIASLYSWNVIISKI